MFKTAKKKKKTNIKFKKHYKKKKYQNFVHLRQINLLGQKFSIEICVRFPDPCEDLNTHTQNKHLQGRILK